MIDVHCHLNFEDYDKDRQKIIKNSQNSLTAVINSGTSFEGNIETLKLSNIYNNFIYPSFGFHPIQSGKLNNEMINNVLSQITEYINDIVAIGEVGMDFFYVKDKTERNNQMEIFKKFCNLAENYKKPIIIHCRDAEKKAFNIVKDYESIPEVIFHSYSGSLKTAQKLIDHNYYMSCSAMIVYSKQHQDLFKEIPVENILTETDSPYLNPNRGIRNVPTSVKMVIDKLAELKKMDFNLVDNITETNAKNVFNI